MCKICLSHPCLSRCPNAPDPYVFGKCEVCELELREDYEYYTDNEGSKLCSLECAIKYHGIKSVYYETD